MTDAEQLIDCYMVVKGLDGSEVTMDKKLEVLCRLPLKIKRRFETVFKGYIVEMNRNKRKIHFFFTFEPRAWNAVLSTVSL
jgi:hypothetical protein